MRRLALVGAVAIAFLATGAQGADTFAVHLVSQDATTITLGWSPQPGYGYLFTVDGVLRSRTYNPAVSTVRFSKQYSSYDIDVIVKGANGHYPLPDPEATLSQTIAQSQTLTGIVNWRAVYDGNTDGVADDPGSVRFYVDGTLVLTELDAPFGDTTGFWDSTTTQNGQHSFRVEAVGPTGVVLATNTVTANVANIAAPKPACSNGVDDDADGKTDYPADPGCLSLGDNDETDTSQPPPGNASLWISPSGNDSNCVRLNQALPCRTLTRAYQVASSGDIVAVAGGSYPGVEQLTGTKTIEFRVAAGQTASLTSPLRFINIENITLRGPFRIDNVGCCSVDGNSGTYALRLQGCNRNVEFYDLSAIPGHFNIGGSGQHIYFYGGEWGGYTQRPFSSDSTVSGYYGKAYTDSRAGCTGTGWNSDGIIRDVLFDGVYFHDCDYEADQGGGHPDCIESSGATDGVVIRNSTFRRCGDTCIGWFTDWWHNYNFVVENNLFQYAYDTAYGIQMGDKDVFPPPFATQGQAAHCSGFVFRYNTYMMDDPAHDGYDDQAPPLIGCDLSPALVYGNIIERGYLAWQGSANPNCPGWSYNVFVQGTPCGPNSKVGNPGFVDNVNYKLGAGSIAIGAGNPSAFPPADYEGTPRSSPPDAGRDQR